jgi:uncharacterized protein (TIGR02147 family)
MTNKNLFNFNDYKSFLKDFEQSQSIVSKGFRSKLANTIGCHSAYVSQVLNSGAHFSLEQALKISHYLGFSDAEQRYFLLLIELARSGTRELKKHFEILLSELTEKHLNIKERVRTQTALSPEDQSVYYSQWYYPAIHMIVTISQFRTIQEISKAFKMNKKLVEKVVVFLISCNLLIEKNGELQTGPSYLHLEKTSPNAPRYQANLRMLAIHSLENQKENDIHYGTVSTLSKKDVEILRSKFVQDIQDYVQTVSQSKEESIYCFNLDFFNLLED